MVRKTSFSRVTRRVPLVEQELLNPSETRKFIPVFSGVHVARSLVFCVVFGRWVFTFLSVVFLSLYCLFFFDVWLLITPLVYSNFFAIICLPLLLFIVSTMYICIFHHNIVDISDATDKKKKNKDCLDGDSKMASRVLILLRSWNLSNIVSKYIKTLLKEFGSKLTAHVHIVLIVFFYESIWYYDLRRIYTFSYHLLLSI